MFAEACRTAPPEPPELNATIGIAEAGGLASVARGGAGGGSGSLTTSGCNNAQDANSREQQTARANRPDPDDG